MSIDKTIKRLALKLVRNPGVAGVVTGLAIIAGYNLYAHHNVSYETDDKEVFQKADGIISFTELELDKKNGEIKITRYGLPCRSFTDRDGDNKVDRIYLGEIPFIRGSHSRDFERDKDLKQYPTIFRDADQDFRQQMQRFKPYMNR